MGKGIERYMNTNTEYVNYQHRRQELMERAEAERLASICSKPSSDNESLTATLVKRLGQALIASGEYLLETADDGHTSEDRKPQQENA